MPLDNHIPERTGPGGRVPTEPKELEENEVIPKRMSPFDGDEDVSNKVSMSSTAQGSNIFERTEVLSGKVLSSPQDSSKQEGARRGIMGRLTLAHSAPWCPFLAAAGCPGALKADTFPKT